MVAGDGKPYHIVSRFFAPWAGIDEDAVTGSAHAVLAPYWKPLLASQLETLHARQCSPRGGDMEITLSDNTVSLKAQAALVLDGWLHLPA